MLHARKTSNLIGLSRRLLCSLFFAGVLGILPISTDAQCSTVWDASGEWKFRQAGQNNLIKLSLGQKGQVVTGKAVLPEGLRIRTPGVRFDEVRDLDGTADGYISGDAFILHIFWVNGSTGVYSGRILPSGKVEGKGHEKGTPHIMVSWDSIGRLRCRTPPASKPFKITYDVKVPKKPTPPSTGTTPGGKPPPVKVPGILASQVIYPIPGSYTGSVVISWDGGPDHPYAEVWYRINNSDPVFLVELGKGSRPISVEKGKLYTYILTDAGKNLATVTFVAN